MLEADDLAVGYDGREVLHGVSLTLHRGDFVGIIGPNGSGKSTLLRALAGVLPLQRGAVRLAGIPLGNYSARALARRLAVVPAVTAPAFAFSVREVVAMGRHPHLGRFSSPGPTDNAAVEEALELADLLYLADRPVDRLSAGELQRVSIARALAQQPEVLLLDEPTAHLDLGHQMDTFALLVRLAREQGLAALCVSHDLNLAAEYCGRVLLLSTGRIAAEGAPTDVITEENLLAVYGTLVRVTPNPHSGLPVVLVTRAPGEKEDEG
jgi:iron complex transport system ATP-binding protein